MWILVQRHNWAFKNEREAITVNDDRYRAMLNKFLFTKIEGEDIGNIWFQQDDDTCRTVEATLDVLCPFGWSELRFETVGLLFVGCRQR